MATEHPGAGVEILAMDACWARLRAAEVGRLAVTIAERPDIFPVNYVVDHGTVVFRTGEGTKLAGAIDGPAVAFEADGYDAETGQAWSVVIKGRAREEKRLEDLVDTARLPLFPWHAAPKPRFVRVVPEEISGRLFTVVDATAWGTPLPDAPRSALE